MTVIGAKMRIVDCVAQMSKFYLNRIVDCFIREEIPRGDEDRLREQILENADEISDRDRISSALKACTLSRTDRILSGEILKALLESPGGSATETDLIGQVRRYENEIITRSQRDDALAYSDARSLDIYKTVLETALEDDIVSEDEFQLLDRLRSKLKLSRLEHKILEAKMGKFPKPGNKLHSVAEIGDCLKRLQHEGIVFYCNKTDGDSLFVLPEENAPGVKSNLKFEMSHKAQELLYSALTSSQLSSLLAQQGLPVSGKKGEKIQRMIVAGCRPSEVLEGLQSSELADICEKLQGVKKSGTKSQRIERILAYYDSLTLKEPEDSDDPRGLYYQYLEEFAARDNKNLYERGLISHDRDMESGFETGTRYLFEVKLGCQLLEFKGTDHADGGVQMKSGDILLWDNKGRESQYEFPKSHIRQFKRYIRESPTRVSVFVVIVPDVGDRALRQATILKHESGQDTDVAIIAAVDLKHIAETWQKYSDEDRFNLEVFNTTGILDRQTLQNRMEILL